VLRHLGLEDDVLRLGVQPGAYVFRLHDTGEVIQEFSLADAHRHQHGAPYVQLHRADLHDLLATAACKLKPDLIRLNRKATGFTETDRGVTLHLADGSSVAGDILIGADGLKSTIARQIVGEIPATYTGDAAWRITVPVERLPKPFLPQVMSLFLGPGGHAVCYYLRGGALLNFVGCVETELAAEESWTQKFPWDLLKKDYEGWHPAVQAIVDAVDKDQCYRWSMHNRPPVRNWSTRRATILGDGLDLYQRNRVDRTARIVEQSTQNRWLFHLPSQQAMRDEFSKRNQGEERNRWLYSYNPLTVELT
jgi:salicylate hydroxylase